MKQKSCSTRQQKMLSTIWGLRSCPRSKNCKLTMPNSWRKKIYAEYRRSREEMRELLTAKANVDRLLKMDEEQKQEKEKDHDQR